MLTIDYTDTPRDISIDTLVPAATLADVREVLYDFIGWTETTKTGGVDKRRAVRAAREALDVMDAGRAGQELRALLHDVQKHTIELRKSKHQRRFTNSLNRLLRARLPGVQWVPADEVEPGDLVCLRWAYSATTVEEVNGSEQAYTRRFYIVTESGDLAIQLNKGEAPCNVLVCIEREEEPEAEEEPEQVEPEQVEPEQVEPEKVLTDIIERAYTTMPRGGDAKWSKHYAENALACLADGDLAAAAVEMRKARVIVDSSKRAKPMATELEWWLEQLDMWARDGLPGMTRVTGRTLQLGDLVPVGHTVDGARVVEVQWLALHDGKVHFGENGDKGKAINPDTEVSVERA